MQRKTSTPPRHAFTMIELVFIIVILGILGAIAVPKMAASREDAQIVTLKQDVATLIQALPAMAMSQGNASTITFEDALNISAQRGRSDEIKTTWRIEDGSPRHSDKGKQIHSLLGHNGKTIPYADNGRHLDGAHPTHSCVVAKIYTHGNETGPDSPISEPYLKVWFNPQGELCKRIGTETMRIPLTGKATQF